MGAEFTKQPTVWPGFLCIDYGSINDTLLADCGAPIKRICTEADVREQIVAFSSGEGDLSGVLRILAIA